MKHKMAALAAAAFMPWLASQAWSQNAGFYAGGALGQAEQQGACDTARVPCDEKDMAWKVFAGYQFNPYLAAELGYADFGASTSSGVNAGVASSGRLEVTAWEFVALGSFPVMDRLALFGKLGIYRGAAKGSGTESAPGGTVSASAKESNTDVTFGFGARFGVTRNLDVRAEWQRYPGVGGGALVEADIDMLSVGLLYRF